ncbi:MAG: hypothetical protein U0Q03_11775 [Acidimicrobiales bacterium]
MIRRTVVAALALVAAVSLSSCATFTDNANAARVGDVGLSRTDLEHYVHDALEARDSADAPTELSGDDFRSIIERWIFDELVRQYLEANQVGVTDADRATAEEQIRSSLESDGITVSDFVVGYEVESLAVRTAYQNYTDGSDKLLKFAQQQDVYVDPVYGVWSIETGTVQALGTSLDAG